ncbi:MAG: glycerol-3-phosphate 1-O-acyltransferase PlsY [Acidobacteriota bacterium]
MTSPGPLALLLAAYLLGSIPFGYLLGRWRGIDVRRRGSRNIGATNVMRHTGWALGFLTFALDAGKGAAAPVLAQGLGLAPGWAAAAGVCAVVGHCFSIFMGFAGGKGVATLVGAFAALDLPVALLGGVVFAASLASTRYVAVSSFFLSLALVAGCLFRHPPADPRLFAAGVGVVLVALRHRDNWRRLREGTEERVFSGAGRVGTTDG